MTIKKLLAVLPVALMLSFFAQAQQPRGGGAGMGRMQQMNNGHLYGKVIDAKTDKGINAVAVELTVTKFDTATKTAKQTLFGTVLSQKNGDFSFDNVPVMGRLTLKIAAIGYADYTQTVSFVTPEAMAKMRDNSLSQADRMALFSDLTDKNIGKVLLQQTADTLASVTVTSTAAPAFQMGVDRKIFSVDKSIVSTGQTAQEVLKQIPTVNVDIDGNVTMRNATPTIFIDNRPTTLTLDQIPSDIIDKVELITNPSAKYDASGGGGGIINIVLKKNKKAGYNGNIQAGIDSRGGPNFGGNINLRQKKFNLFANARYMRRISKMSNQTNMVNVPSDTSTMQTGNGNNNGHFAFFNVGSDFFLDNSNTLTIAGTMVDGRFNNNQPQTIDSLASLDPASVYSQNSINSLSQFHFKNYGGQLSYRHNFSKNGHDITADANYNSSTNTNSSNINQTSLGNKYNPISQIQTGTGYNKRFTGQIDYENPITDKMKIEAGARLATLAFESDSRQWIDSSGVGVSESPEFFKTLLSSDYKYNQAVWAGYATYTLSTDKWNYQLGLRMEGSNYKGTNSVFGTNGQIDSVNNFKISYPVNLFPSAFVTYKINDKEDLQMNYSRKINRPGFFQMIPTYSFSNPQNITVGNPNLNPEFTNMGEISYSNNYKTGANFLATIYMRYTTNLMTSYMYKGYIPGISPSDSSYINTFINADHSSTYGLELTNRITLVKIWELTANFNLFNSKIVGGNLSSIAAGNSGAGVTNQQWSWFAKLNNNFKLPKSFSVQLSAQYQAKTILPASSGSISSGGGGGGGRGGGGFNFMPGTSQGYIKPMYGVDIAVKKDWAFKGGSGLSATLSMNDIFRTNWNKTYSETSFMYQNSARLRDPQVLRFTISYRFGKMDASLFKRKNTKQSDNGASDMMNGQG
ncbi:MAG: TonB-dependent receptor [Chitinophagaceae bacterium]|jgi:outer membrane receptor protein involved in Fe transport|nr:TonB-dependent receptor [Chitinophagaceae bacterium]